MARRNRAKCVAIAKDVLAQIRLGRYKATAGTYVELDLPDSINDDYVQWQKTMDSSFKKFFKQEKQATCEVCAIGATFVSLVNIDNKASVRAVSGEIDMFHRVHKYFGHVNATLMESAFEQYPIFNEAVSDALSKAAAVWGEQYEDDTARLQTIMRNIIRNDGDFKLPKKLLAKARRLEKEDMACRSDEGAFSF